MPDLLSCEERELLVLHLRALIEKVNAIAEVLERRHDSYCDLSNAVRRSNTEFAHLLERIQAAPARPTFGAYSDSPPGFN
jgi:hypothetical protein